MVVISRFIFTPTALLNGGHGQLHVLLRFSKWNGLCSLFNTRTDDVNDACHLPRIGGFDSDEGVQCG